MTAAVEATLYDNARELLEGVRSGRARLADLARADRAVAATALAALDAAGSRVTEAIEILGVLHRRSIEIAAGEEARCAS